MAITCFIRYQIDPFQREQFRQYAENWGRIIPRCGGNLLASLSQPAKLLSLSFWRDEAAVRAWRETALHRAYQAQARAGIFDDYRLRVAAVVRDYGLHERRAAPGDSRQAHGR